MIVYRVASDIAEQDGPFEIFSLIRGWTEHDAVPYWVWRGMQCPICISWWLAAIVAIYHADIRYFATAGVTVLIVKLLQRDE